MNAPMAPHFTTVPLTAIALSQTHIQQLRRERFDQTKLKELAASISSLGLQQPVVLRPYPDATVGIDYELVAGERRYLASRIAGVAAIDAKVSALTDDQVLEIQLVENLQREDLHEIEEAEGYHELMKLKSLSADAVGEIIGKSRSYVFGRLKLLSLCPEGRKACYAGHITPSVALLVARIPHHDTQRQCLKNLLDRRPRADVPITYQNALHIIQNEYMVELKGTSFKLEDAALLPKAGPCTTCPKRTGNQKDLFTDVKNPNVCTDPKCFEEKQAAAREQIRQAEIAKGRTVITGKEAQAIRPNQYGGLARGYVSLDEEAYLDGKYQSYRKALGKHAPETALLEDPHSDKLIPIAKGDQLAKALKDAGIKKASNSGSYSGGADRAKVRKAQIETAVRMAILRFIRAANRNRTFDLADTVLVAQAYFHRADFDAQKRIVDNRLAEAGEAKPKGHDYVGEWGEAIKDLPPAEMATLLIDLALIGECHANSYSNDKPELLLATAERLGIDADLIRSRVQAEMAEKKKPAKAKSKGVTA